MRKILFVLLAFFTLNCSAQDLIDRLSGASLSANPPRPKISIHQFAAAVRLYAAGVVTRAEIAQDWQLQGQESTDATAIANALDALPTTLQKIVFIERLVSVLYLVESPDDTIYHTTAGGAVNKARVKADIGF